MIAKKAVICLSGGMDSTSLMLHLLARGYSAYGISFDYGQKHKMELEFLGRNLAYLHANGHQVAHQTVNLAELGSLFFSSLLNPDWEIPKGHYEQDNMKETVVPNRNAIFASISYGFAWSLAKKESAVVHLSLGVHSGDHAIYPDCRPEFYEALWKAFEAGNWDNELVELYVPYLEMDKADILRDAQESVAKLGLDFDKVFSNTLTSYQPDQQGRAHGLTGSDVERILAFHELGLQDPIEYQMPWEAVVKMAVEIQGETKT